MSGGLSFFVAAVCHFMPNLCDYYPPNGWNCLCGVEQLTQEEAESDPMFGKEPADVHIVENFRNNPGKDRTIWGDWLEDRLN